MIHLSVADLTGGIGRELYTAPFIWIPADKCNILEKSKKDAYGNPVYTCVDKFYVEAIQIIDKEITGLSIKNQRTNERVFVYKKGEK